MSKSLDPDWTRRLVGPDLCPAVIVLIDVAPNQSRNCVYLNKNANFSIMKQIDMIILPFIDTLMFYTKYLAMRTGAIRKLLSGVCVCTGDNPLAKAGELSTVQTQKPYINLHLFGYLYLFA